MSIKESRFLPNNRGSAYQKGKLNLSVDNKRLFAINCKKGALKMDEKKIKEFRRLLLSSEIYDSGDPDFLEYQNTLTEKIVRFNETHDTVEGLKERERILRETAGTYGEGLYVIPPLYTNCGLINVHFGKNVFINHGVILVDDGKIEIGDDTMIGPAVKIATAVHPVSPKLRKAKLQYNKPVKIGKNVWIGSGAIILPGVTVGDNTIIGAGAVVSKDIPSNVIALGVPAKVVREITEKDDLFFDGDKPIPQEIIDKYLK